MMVSRQETQRHLLTPGEIIQLPPDKEVVMVLGTPPVLAKKLGYFEDRNFTGRVLPAAAAAAAALSLALCSDWPGRLAQPDMEGLTADAANDGDAGREISHELEPEMEPAPDMDVPCEEAMEDDPIDPMDAGHLDAVRKALALDEVDQDMIPER